MPRRAAPDPQLDVLAVRAAGRYIASLLAKGIGPERARDAAMAFLCGPSPPTRRRTARAAADMALAEAIGRGLLPPGRPPEGGWGPLTLLAALAAPALPEEPDDGRHPATPRQAAALAAARPARSQAPPSEAGDHGAAPHGPAVSGFGKLRVIRGGRDR